MNIDLQALRTIESERNVPVKDLLEAIAGALLYSYLDYRESNAGGKVEGAKSRVDIDTTTGAVSVIVSERDPETGEVTTEYDDTPENFGRVGAQAVREAILRKLREAGLIDCERRGTWVYYWPVPDATAAVRGIL